MQSSLNITTHLTPNNLKTWSSDQQALLDKLRNQDKNAFSILYKQYSAAIYGSILNKVSDRAKASKVLEETFICVWNNISTYDETKLRLFTWIAQISMKLARKIQ